MQRVFPGLSPRKDAFTASPATAHAAPSFPRMGDRQQVSKRKPGSVQRGDAPAPHFDREP